MRGGIQAETGIETLNSIPPLILLVFQSNDTDGGARHAAIGSLIIACESAGHGAALCDTTRQAALTGLRGCFAGFETSGIAGKAGSGCVSATFDSARRNPLGKAEPHGIDVADSPSGCVKLP